MAFAALVVLGYLLGSCPWGYWLVRLVKHEDIRRVGSGNIGATNVLRTGRKGLAAATLLGDALKGAVAVWFVTWFGGPDLGVLAALGAFLGHLFPIWLNFKGGKGVATYIGLLLALAWPAAIFFCVVWIVVAALTRYSSLAALIASAATPAFLWGYQHDLRNAGLFLVLSALLWIMHRANIARLVSGREGKIGGSRTPATDGPTTHQ
jgi:acyl phosphate:glycerol-3-phosphate acyltransferase